MRAITFVGVLLAFLIGTSQVFAWQENQRDPRGERAFFQVVQDSNRTSRLIRGGDIIMRVLQEPLSYEPLEYAVRLDYRLVVFLRGEQRGHGHLFFLQEVFEESFLFDLRENRYYEAEFFKAEHIGYATVRNIDGRTYPNSDRVRLYDIEDPMTSGFEDLLRAVAATKLATPDPERPYMGVENMEIIAHVSYGHPVFGGVRLDISGVVDGVNVKIGADYLPGR